MFKKSPETQDREEAIDDGVSAIDKIVLLMFSGVRGGVIDSSSAWDGAQEDGALMKRYRRQRLEGKLDEPEPLQRPV